MNDSLDFMRKEFLQQYKDLMVETQTAKGSVNKGALNEMMRSVGINLNNEQILKQLYEENEFLKGVIEKMKNEMEIVV